MQEHDASILRGAAIPTAIVGVLVVIFFAALQGFDGALGAAFGTVVVGVFFSLSLVVTSRASRSGPAVMMGAAMATYFVKIALLGLLLVSLRDTSAFDFLAFGSAILIGTAVWLTFQVRAFLRAKILYVEPRSSGARR